jgi:hypothetical protein
MENKTGKNPHKNQGFLGNGVNMFLFCQQSKFL